MGVGLGGRLKRERIYVYMQESGSVSPNKTTHTSHIMHFKSALLLLCVCE